MPVQSVGYTQSRIQNNPNKNDGGASLAAYYGSGLVSGAIVSPIPIISSKFIKMGSNLSEETIDTFHKGFEQAVKMTGMDKKGVTIHYLPQTNRGKVQILNFDIINSIKNGNNACHLSKDFTDATGKIFKKNSILMPEKDLSFAGFHELGHAINNKNFFWNCLQKLRVPGYTMAGLIMMYGAFTNKIEKPQNRELTKLEKAHNFVRDNAGKLTFAAVLPTLAEEAMASIRAQKLANKILDKNLAKQVLKGNALAYTTYALGAVSLAVGSYCAVKIKDIMMSKKK